MKFIYGIQKIPENKFKKVESNQSKNDNQLNVIDSIYRYGNVGVYVMKNGKKGLFREIASYVNDGIKPTSWALKIFHTDDWYIQFGINPNVDFTKNDIYLSELLSVFEEKYELIKVTGNRKVVLISKIEDKYQAEQIANYIINMFEEIELDFIDSKIDKIFEYNESSKPMRITGFFPNSKSDKETQKKFVEIVEKLSSVRLSTDDLKKFNIIKKRIYNNMGLRDKDKKTLNSLMKDYFSAHERVSIAMKYLKKD